MKNIIAAIIIGLCIIVSIYIIVNNFPNNEIGRYQLLNGEYPMLWADGKGTGIDMHKGLFRIDTTTGKVEEYTARSDTTGHASNWHALETIEPVFYNKKVE